MGKERHLLYFAVCCFSGVFFSQLRAYLGIMAVIPAIKSCVLVIRVSLILHPV